MALQFEKLAFAAVATCAAVLLTPVLVRAQAGYGGRGGYQQGGYQQGGYGQSAYGVSGVGFAQQPAFGAAPVNSQFGGAGSAGNSLSGGMGFGGGFGGQGTSGGYGNAAGGYGQQGIAGGYGQQQGGQFGQRNFVGRDASEVGANFQGQFGSPFQGGQNFGQNLQNFNDLREQRRRWRDQQNAPPPVRVQLRPAFDLPLPPAGAEVVTGIQTRVDGVLASRGGTAQVTMTDAGVVLTGNVGSDHDRRLMAVLASLEPGVSRVENRLTVTPAAPPIAPVEAVTAPVAPAAEPTEPAAEPVETAPEPALEPATNLP